MSLSRVTRCGIVTSVIITLIIVQAIRARAVAAQETSPAPAAKSDVKQEMLAPCLAVAADGSPIWPSTSFPPSKRLTVAFRLPPDDASKKLESRWIAVVGPEGVIAENSLDLNGQKTGWLRLALKQPAPPGKYRLDTTLDGKPWKSVDVEVTPPIESGKAAKASDFIPLTEGHSMTYDMLVRGDPGAKVDVPGVTPDADGTSRTTLTTTVGKTDDACTQYAVTINGKPTGEMCVKLDDTGLRAVRRQMTGGEAEKLDPPLMLHPLPPSLEDGTEWTHKGPDGGELKLVLFGPLPLVGPDGPATGYLVFGDEQISTGKPGTEALRGRETTERQYIPKVGLVRESKVTVLGGKRTSIEINLPSSKPYKLVANPNMKGKLGRVQFAYPAETKFSEARVAVFKADAKPNEKPAVSGYGAEGFEMMPGKYLAALNNKRVPIEVKSGHDTVPACGVLRVHAGSETRFKVLDADRKTELYDGYGEQDIPLPVGTYMLQIGGSSEPVKIEDGKVTEF